MKSKTAKSAKKTTATKKAAKLTVKTTTKKASTKSTAKKAVAGKAAAAKVVGKKLNKTSLKKAVDKTIKNSKKAVKSLMKQVSDAAHSLTHSSKSTAVTNSPLKLGQKITDFQLPATGGKDFKLSDLKGKKVVLYFYPKDSTPGCTIEGKDFSQLKNQFEAKNTVVFGISRDSMKSHENFKSKQNYTIELISDADEKACAIFDVIKEKNMYGKMVMGIERSTFLIDEKGCLAKEWRKVKVEGHAEEVLASI